MNRFERILFLSQRITRLRAELALAETAFDRWLTGAIIVDTGTGPYEMQIGVEPMPMPEPDRVKPSPKGTP
jgi:hypothetical protein